MTRRGNPFAATTTRERSSMRPTILSMCFLLTLMVGRPSLAQPPAKTFRRDPRSEAPGRRGRFAGIDQAGGLGHA